MNKIESFLNRLGISSIERRRMKGVDEYYSRHITITTEWDGRNQWTITVKDKHGELEIIDINHGPKADKYTTFDQVVHKVDELKTKYIFHEPR